MTTKAAPKRSDDDLLESGWRKMKALRAIDRLEEIPGGIENAVFDPIRKRILEVEREIENFVTTPIEEPVTGRVSTSAVYRGRGRVTKSERDQIIEQLVIKMANVRKIKAIETGMPRGKAGEMAAEWAAKRLGEVRINLSATTIYDRMKRR
jgi:hypothetical protein